MKILIGMPCMATIPVETIGCFNALDKPKGTELMMVSQSLVYDSRNQICDRSIEGGFSHILFIDSDMTFPPDGLTKLLERDKDIVTGVYYARREPHFPVIYKRLCPRTLLQKQVAENQEPLEGVFPIVGCGMGFCLIKTDVIKKINKKRFLKPITAPFEPMDGLGEDLSFCYRAKENGFEIWADNTFEVGHVGTKIYTAVDWQLVKMKPVERH